MERCRSRKQAKAKENDNKEAVWEKLLLADVPVCIEFGSFAKSYYLCLETEPTSVELPSTVALVSVNALNTAVSSTQSPNAERKKKTRLEILCFIRFRLKMVFYKHTFPITVASHAGVHVAPNICDSSMYFWALHNTHFGWMVERRMIVVPPFVPRVSFILLAFQKFASGAATPSKVVGQIILTFIVPGENAFTFGTISQT